MVQGNNKTVFTLNDFYKIRQIHIHCTKKNKCVGKNSERCAQMCLFSISSPPLAALASHLGSLSLATAPRLPVNNKAQIKRPINQTL